MPQTEKASAHMGAIRQIKLFKYLSEPELKLLLSEADVLPFRLGEAIVQQGDMSEYLFAVLSGSVDVSVRDLESEVFICTIHPGEVFGESAIFMSEKRTATIVAAEACRVIRIHRADILYFLRQYPKGGIKILMLVLNSLLTKLRAANMEIILDRQSFYNLDEDDPLIRAIMKAE